METNVNYTKEVLGFYEEMWAIERICGKRLSSTNLKEVYLIECFLASFNFYNFCADFYEHCKIIERVYKSFSIDDYDRHIIRDYKDSEKSFKDNTLFEGYLIELMTIFPELKEKQSINKIIRLLFDSNYTHCTIIDQIIHGFGDISEKYKSINVITLADNFNYNNVDSKLKPLIQNLDNQAKNGMLSIIEYSFSTTLYNWILEDNIKGVIVIINNLLNQLDRDDLLVNFIEQVIPNEIEFFYTDFSFSPDKLHKNISKYIPKQNENKEITIYDIVKHIFTLDIVKNSKYLKKLFSSKGYPKDYFLNFDENFEKFKKLKKEDEMKKQEEINQKINLIEKKGNTDFFEYLKIVAQIEKLIVRNINVKPVEGRIANINVNHRHDALTLGLYFTNEDFKIFLENNNFTLENCLSLILNINIKEFLEFKNIPVNVEEIIDTILKAEKKINIFEYYDCQINNYDNHTLESGICDDKMKNLIDKYEKYQKFNKYINREILELDTTSVNTIATYGEELSDLSKFIYDEFGNFMKSSIDMNKLSEMKNLINSIEIKSNFFSKIFKNNNHKLDKETLDNLSQFLDEQEEIIKEEIEKFGPLKQLLEAYVKRIQKYISNLQLKRNEEISIDYSENSNENILKKQENAVKQNIIDGKINDFLLSSNIMYQEYIKVCTVEAMYALNLNKIVTAKVSLIPTLYMELLLTNGILTMNEIGQSVTLMKSLIGDMSQLSTEYITRNFEKLIEANNLCIQDNLKLQLENNQNSKKLIK